MSMAKMVTAPCLLTNCERPEREEVPEPWDGGKLDSTENTVRKEVERWDGTSTYGPMS